MRIDEGSKQDCRDGMRNAQSRLKIGAPTRNTKLVCLSLWQPNGPFLLLSQSFYPIGKFFNCFLQFPVGILASNRAWEMLLKAIMNDSSDSNYISVKSWMWMMFVTAIPLLGLIMMIVWSFSGDNESRKNYFRAIFMWFFLLLLLAIGFALLGDWPAISNHFHHTQTHKL
jgi:hypothetical protein